MSVSAPFRGNHYWIWVVLSQTDSYMSQSSRGETPRGMDGSSTDPFQLWHPCSNKLTLGGKERVLKLLISAQWPRDQCICKAENVEISGGQSRQISQMMLS